MILYDSIILYHISSLRGFGDISGETGRIELNFGMAPWKTNIGVPYKGLS